ncbi:MAG: Gldg family protein [Ketobacteraceae bacterium]|nr:Gldg family protein [Ketobacteraceae bacterium]
MGIRKLFSTVGLVVLAGLVLISTLITDALFQGMRIDLTENNLYTLSEGSKNIASGVEEPVELYFFFSRDATKNALDWRNYGKQVQELLEEFELASDGRITLHVIDPEPFSEEEDQAAEYGLEPVNLTAGGDPVYFGLAAKPADGDKAAEVIPFFQPDRQEFLEYDIARLIYQASQTSKPVVGLLTDLQVNGGFDMMTRQPRQPWIAISQLKQLFDVRNLPRDLEEIEDTVDLLLVIHPKALPDNTLYAIDQFVLGGGRAMVFLDPLAEQDSQSMMAGPTAADLASDIPRLLAAWGVDYDPLQFVGDYQLALPVGVEPGRPPVKHLGILQLTEENHAIEDDIVISQLESINLSSAGYLEPREDAGTNFQPLLVSTEYAMPMPSEKLTTIRNPAELTVGFEPTGKQYVFAARVTGQAKTAFPNGVPVESNEAGSGTEGTENDEDSSPSAASEKSDAPEESADDPEQVHAGKINVVIVADTDILSDRLWVQVQSFFGQQIAQPFADNNAFLTNSVDYLSGSSDLIEIRSRGRFIRPFTVVQDMNREAQAAFHEKEQRLQQQLEATEQKLMELQNQRDDKGNALTLTPEQQQEIERFEEQKLEIRKQLREVQHQLNKDIDQLAFNLKLINITAVPALLTLIVIVVALVRRRRLRG